MAGLVWFGCSTPNEPDSSEEVKVRVHPPDWLKINAANFHGSVLAAKGYAVNECRQCHGNNYDGGLVGISCRTCHPTYPHPSGWADVGENSHSQYIKSRVYQFGACKTCHGQDYGTVKLDKSCLTCHQNEGGPEACNTCHGDFAARGTDLRIAAPPAGLDNETEETDPAVGMHRAHLDYFEDVEATCAECHKVPASLDDPGHIDADGEAEVLFQGPLALLSTGGGDLVPAPEYNHETRTCSGVYCHGNWMLKKSLSERTFIYTDSVMVGNAAAPVWNDHETGECGSCHDLPPKGHTPFPLTGCATCHGDVIDSEGKIIDEGKHINGKVNVFTQEYPMF